MSEETIINPTDVAIYRVLKETGEIPRERLVELVHSLLKDSDNWSAGKGSIHNRISKLEKDEIIKTKHTNGYALKRLNEEKKFEVKQAFEDKTLEKIAPEGETSSKSEEVLTQRAYAEKLSPELENLKKWIRNTNLDMTVEKPHLPSKWDYEPKDGYAYSQLSESIPDLKDRIEDFREKVTRQSDALLSYSRLLDSTEKASSVRRCYSKTSWKSSIESLDRCLQEEGIDLGEDRHLGRNSDGELVADRTTSVKERLIGLDKLVKLTEELKRERGKILKRLNKYLHLAELPQIPEKEGPEE